MTWDTVEDVLQAWIVAGSGLADAKVLWGEQGLNRPAPPYITCMVIDDEDVGQAIRSHEYDSGGSAGAEIIHYVRQPKIITLSVQCYGAAAIGSSNPTAILQNVKLAADLESRRELLNAAKVGIATISKIHRVPDIVGADPQPRAAMTVRFHTTLAVTETGGYIDNITAQGTDDLAGDPFTIS